VRFANQARLKAAGYRTKLTYPHWLGKVHRGLFVVDLIFSSGNGLCDVDQNWFDFARPAAVLGMPVRLVPVVEMIWQKAFIMERHRFDGAEVAHLLHCCCETLDWDRLLDRFNEHWPLLLAHLVLAQFIYPDDTSPSIRNALSVLVERQQRQTKEPHFMAELQPVCCGTLLSLLEYLPAIQEWGYRDARLPPSGKLTPDEIEHWTATFER
jgi:hypothetical protein